MSVFDHALELTLGREGGKADVKGDRGGLTFRGITQNTYSRWRRAHGLPAGVVTDITDAEVRTIALHEYWRPAHCDALPAKLAMCVFDAAFNHSPARAIRLLQTALDIPADGLFGPHTRDALAAADELETVRRYLDARQDFYDEIIEHDPTQIKFAHGWANRVIAMRTALLTTEGIA